MKYRGMPLRIWSLKKKIRRMTSAALERRNSQLEAAIVTTGVNIDKNSSKNIIVVPKNKIIRMGTAKRVIPHRCRGQSSQQDEKEGEKVHSTPRFCEKTKGEVIKKVLDDIITKIENNPSN